MEKRIWMNIMVGMLLTLIILSGCGDASEKIETGGKGKEEPIQNQSEPISDVTKESLELVFFSNSRDSVESFDERFGEAIRKKYPNYTINYIQASKTVNFQSLIAGGQPIDIYWDSVGYFLGGMQASGMQYDMTELIKKANIDLSRFETTDLDAMRQMSDGKLYGLPVATNTLSLFYNKDIFEKFGVSYLEDGMTWEEILEKNRLLTRTEENVGYTGLALSKGHIVRLNPLSLPLVDPLTQKVAISNEKYGEQWKQLFHNAFVIPSEAAGYRTDLLPQTNQFIKEKTLAIYGFLTSLVFTQDVESLDWDMISFPRFKEALNMEPQSYPIYFSVTSTSKHKEAAMEVIRFLVSDENQMQLSRKGNMPVVKNTAVRDAFGRDTKFTDKNLQSIYYYKQSPSPIMAKTIYDDVVFPIYIKYIDDLAAGRIDINTMIRKIDEEGNQAINSFNNG